MKLPVAGDSYQNRQLAAGAQESLNFYREAIEDPAGSGKSTKILRQAPGAHLLADLSISGVVRGFWSGGGRLFVCVGTTVYELGSTGATIDSHVLAGSTGSNGKPVQMFGSPNQLGIVADGFLYVDNGVPPPLISFGPLQVRFQISGVLTVVTVGAVTTATWTGGDKFPTAIVGIYIFVNGVPNYVVSRTNSTTIVLADSVGGTGTCATGLAGLPTGGLTNTVYWQSGSTFLPAWVGLPIIINGITYTVDTVIGPYVLTIRESVLSVATAVAFSVIQSNLVYSGAAGALVTATTGAYLDGSIYVQRPAATAITYTDLVITATTTNVTSSAHPFDETLIGEVIIISGGTGFITGTYAVVSVDYAHVATLNAVVGTAASTGGTGTGYPEDLGRTVNFSAVNDFTNFSGLDFFQKESAADYIQSILAARSQLYVFGQEYETEVWGNDLNTGRPVRINGATFAEPSAARYAAVTMRDQVYFIGGAGNPIAYRLDGFTPTRISTHAVEAAWALKGAATSTAVAWTYNEDGHYFWVIWWSSGSTWVYDATEKSWHERTAWVSSAYAPYRWKFHTFIPEWGTNGRHIVGDYNSGKVMVLSSAFYDEEGTDMKQVRIMPYLYAGGNKRVYCNRIDLEIATGLIPSGAEPTITLEWSLDNGLTWSTPEAVGFGVHDATTKRVYWIAQGSGEGSMLPRLSITGQAQTVIIDCEAEVFLGDS